MFKVINMKHNSLIVFDMLLATKPILPYKVMLEAERDLIKEESSRTPGGFRSGLLELLEHFFITCLSMVLALGEKD